MLPGGKVYPISEFVVRPAGFHDNEHGNAILRAGKIADALEMLADAQMQSLFAAAVMEEELRIVVLSQELDGS